MGKSCDSKVKYYLRNIRRVQSNNNYESDLAGQASNPTYPEGYGKRVSSSKPYRATNKTLFKIFDKDQKYRSMVD